MRVRYEDQARVELLESALFYEQRQPGLGDDFADAVEAIVNNAAADPSRFPIVEDNVQRCRIKRFPYCVYSRLWPMCSTLSQLFTTAETQTIGKIALIDG